MLSSVISVISLTSQRAGLRDHVQKSARSPIQVAHLVVGYNGRNVDTFEVFLKKLYVSIYDWGLKNLPIDLRFCEFYRDLR